MFSCETWKSIRERCNENCDDWEGCPLAEILREGKRLDRSVSFMRRRRLRDMWPVACALIGVCVLSFNLALGLGLCFISAISMFRTINRSLKEGNILDNTP